MEKRKLSAAEPQPEERPGTDVAGREEEKTEAQEIQTAKESWKAECEAVQAAQESRESGDHQGEAVRLNMTGEKRKKFYLKGSIAVKVTAFILLFVSIIVGFASTAGCYIVAEEGGYLGLESGLLKDCLSVPAERVAYEVRDRLASGYEEAVDSYLSGINAEVAVLEQEDMVAPDSSVFLWQSYDEADAKAENGFYSPIYLEYIMYLPGSFTETGLELKDSEEQRGKTYLFRVFIDPEMKADDEIRIYYNLAAWIYELRFAMIGLLIGCVLMVIICFVFLLCSAGHRNGKSGITPGPLTRIHFDVVTAVAGFLGAILSRLFIEMTYYYGSMERAVAGGVVLLAAGVLLMFWLMDFAIRLKMGNWWEHTLIYIILRLVYRVLKFVMRGLWNLLKALPTVMVVMTAYLGICILELLGMAAFVYREEAFVLWGLEKAVLFAVVLYIAVVCRRLLDASSELAEGREDYRVDTRHLFGAFREHGENLNSLGQGISKAVAERMRSEHLKTELITNVSHDLKTPLTSIINYANLICEEKTENPKIQEYSEVLLRQTGRLKKLLEDLVEASKATTGNVEVNLEPCEVGVLLIQAVGEYQQRMAEKGLELRDRQPEYPVKILADGRHLWRVFDNLLNNICKYAQENSRVYLSLEQQENRVFIVFRNMSKYALDIAPEELEERFVRGDKSRHMEGNGLGLSIAKSLTELQGGALDILIDGDLFKVTLSFSALKE